MLIVLIALLAFIIIPNIELIKERLGFETRATLKVKVEAQKIVIDDLTSSNDNLMETIIVTDAINDIKEESVVKQEVIVDTVKETVKEVVTVKKKQIKKIKTNKSLSEHQQSQAISKVQIDTIWSSYCDFNTNPQCGVTT